MWQEQRRISNNFVEFNRKLSLHFFDLLFQAKSFDSSKSLFTKVLTDLDDETRELKHGLAELHVSKTLSVTLATMSGSTSVFLCFSDVE